jgi:hypothetical protein
MLPHEKTRLLLLNDLQSGGSTALLYTVCLMSIAEQTVSGTNNKQPCVFWIFFFQILHPCAHAARVAFASTPLYIVQ